MWPSSGKKLLLRGGLSVLTSTLLAGCFGRSLPPFEEPLKRSEFQKIRTTAYTHTESDHLQYANRNALGTALKSGEINSAAADWSRWPAGTIFRVLATGELYEVDDYGWAISGTNTIDLYKPTRSEMNDWGVRRVTIQVLQWGDLRRSYRILKPRADHKHIRRMLKEIEDQ